RSTPGSRWSRSPAARTAATARAARAVRHEPARPAGRRPRAGAGRHQDPARADGRRRGGGGGRRRARGAGAGGRAPARPAAARHRPARAERPRGRGPGGARAPGRARDHPVHARDRGARVAGAAGAAGYLLKESSVPELELALRAVMQGKTWLSPAISKTLVDDYVRRVNSENVPAVSLTPRQREILQLIAEGHSTKEMAFRLGVSVKTIETPPAQLMERLGIHDVAGLVRYAIRTGIVSTER